MQRFGDALKHGKEKLIPTLTQKITFGVCFRLGFLIMLAWAFGSRGPLKREYNPYVLSLWLAHGLVRN